MVNVRKDEKKVLYFIYTLCFLCFTNLAFIGNKFDSKAIIMAVVLCVLIGYSYFVIRKFFSDGDKYIFILSSLLSVIGITMIYRLSPGSAVKQVIWFALGVTTFILIVVILPDIRRFGKWKYVFMALTLIFMSMSLIYGTIFGVSQGGSKNWVVIGGRFSFQPSEFGKLFLVAYLASSLQQYKERKDLIEPAIIVMFSLGFMVLQKDLGTALILFGMSVTMLYIATSKKKYVITCLLLFIVGCVISYKLFDHVQIRVKIWKDPMAYFTTNGYQIVQSLIAISSGGLFGSGLGLGMPTEIPVNTTDFIFSAICEELGIVTGFAVIILQFLLFYRCMRAAINGRDKFSRLLAVGYSATIASQTLVIIGGVINFIPLTGITLPLVSYGGTSLLITFCMLGIIQKISEER